MTTRRLYVDTSAFRAPESSPNLTLTGLGAPDELLAAWPKGRVYWDVSQFRSPYRDGYFQDNSLFGLGEPPPGLVPVPAPVAATLKQYGPEYLGLYLEGKSPAPGTVLRDVESTSAQIPQWVWLLAAAGVGYAAYRAAQKPKTKR